MSQLDVRQYWEKRFERGPSLATVGWLGLGLAYNRWMYRVRAAVFTRRVRDAFRKRAIALKTARILDVGSGSGFYIGLWRRLGVSDVQGCDLTAAAVAKLQQVHSDCRFVQADIGDATLSHTTSSFDAISAMDVFFHIVDDARYAQAIQNCAALLRPGGLLMFSDNFVHGASQRSAHQASRSLDEIEAIVRASGLSIDERRPMFVLMNAPIDTNNRAILQFWSLLTRIVRRSEIFGFLAGALLYPIELVSASALKEGPSTELMICSKQAS